MAGTLGAVSTPPPPPPPPGPSDDDRSLVQRVTDPVRDVVDGVTANVRATRRAVRHVVNDATTRATEPIVDAARTGKVALDRRLVERERRRRRREVLRTYRRTGLKLPWRAYVVRARKAYAHLVGTMESLPEGPLREELESTEPRVVAGLAALAEAAAAGQALKDRLDELRPLVPRRGWLRSTRNESEAVRSSREAVEKLDAAVVEARARLSEQSLALVEVATHALDLTVGGNLGPRVERLVEDLVALETSLEKVPRAGFQL